MNVRIARVSAVVVAAILLAACGSKLMFNKAAYDQVKKVAVIHYAINPSMLVGAANVPDLQRQVADANVKTLVEKLTGMGYDIVPLAEMQANDAYKAFAAEQSGFIAPTGMRMAANNRPWEYNELPPATATQICTALGVDAVVVASENWTVRGGGVGPFQKVGFMSQFFVQMFDKAGQQIWQDKANESSTDGLAMIGGVLTSPDGVVVSASQSVAASLDVIRERLAAARAAPGAAAK